MPAPSLAAAVVISESPDAAGALLRAALGLLPVAARGAGAPLAALAVGQTVLAIVPPGHPLTGGAIRPGVHHLVFAVDDPEAAARAAGLAVTPVAGLGDTPHFALDPAATAGARIHLAPLATPLATPAPLAPRFDHVGIASADNAAAIGVFRDRLGLPLESQQTDMEIAVAIETFTSDKYGVVTHARPPVPVGGLRVAFLTAGETELEFLQNFDPAQGGEVRHDTAGTTRQDQGAIARYVARHGPGLHHLAFRTPDIGAALAAMERAGARLIDRTGRPGSRRALIGFVHPAALGGVLVHFVQRP